MSALTVISSFMKVIPSVDGMVKYTINRQALLDAFNLLLEDLKSQDAPQNRSIQVANLVAFLAARTDFLNAPASTKYHLCCDYGLLAHSVAVTLFALEFNEFLTKIPFSAGLSSSCLPNWAIVTSGLFHDVGKVGTTGTQHHSRYIPNMTKKGISEAAPFKYNDDALTMPIATQSLSIVSHFVSLTEAETQAILGHDGQYIAENRIFAQNETPLLLILHYADYWCARTVEDAIPFNMGLRGTID